LSQLFIGLQGLEISAEEALWLARPDVGGVVLFSRNFESVNQLQTLNESIRVTCPGAIICIDQEGGRVQRILEPCTPLPALGGLGVLYDDDNDEGLALCFQHGWLMASEMLALGCDLSFAPVLDLNQGSEVIGDRAFHHSIEAVKDMSRAYIKGMHSAGMVATGKHFPGHGSVVADTHHAIAVDEREFDAIAIADLRAFNVAIRQGLDAVMMAHVIYPKVCSQPAGYSQAWCQQILRQRIGFQGLIFSDDLGMRAATDIGDYSMRLRASLDAGCDICLVCRPEDVRQAMDQIEPPATAVVDVRDRLRGKFGHSWDDFSISTERELAQVALSTLEE
jgi:beta-N-acetylhexosaminidase